MNSMNSGLSSREAKLALASCGFNELHELIKVSPYKILLRQINKNFILYLLILAAVLSFFVGKSITGYTICVIIVTIITIGFVQEYKAERSLQALKQMIMPVSIVLRDGKEVEVSSRELVPNDILLLRSGEKIPADCIILDENELRVDESVLTGESVAVRKSAAKAKPAKSTKPAERENLLFMGTHIVHGKCTARVATTGMNTEFGKIAGLISSREKQLPMQDEINDLVKYMVVIALVFSFLSGFIILYRSIPFYSDKFIEVLIVMIALSVAGFPEGLPLVLISTLAAGTHRMAKQNAIVNRMSVIESLGETTVICADKTGTITTGEMTVRKIFANDNLVDVSGVGYESKGQFTLNGRSFNPLKNPALKLLLKTAVLCNDSAIERSGKDAHEEYSIRGSPTEVSLLIMSAKAGLFKEDLSSARKEEIPFSSERKMMTVVCKESSRDNSSGNSISSGIGSSGGIVSSKGLFVYSKGAPEILLEKCKFYIKNGKTILLNSKEKSRLLKVNKNLTHHKFRVLGLACKKTNSAGLKGLENGMIFLGLVALEDPPRDEVKGALRVCQEAGIKVKMITGDSKDTALEIAKAINLHGNLITGAEIDKLSDDKLAKAVNNYALFARVRPEHKLRIVTALQKNDEIVTMTGDGVNDAPALKGAHIGVAMGKNGTDVAREAADLILKDDNFATIVNAVREGRTIFSNMQKFIAYQISCNYSQLIIIFLAVLFDLPLPLLALQILFMNLVTDDLPALTLGFNPPSFDVLKSRGKRTGILDKQILGFVFLAAAIMSLVTLAVFYFTLNVLHYDISVARTTTLITLILFEIANAFNFRSFRYPVYKLPLQANKYLVYASIASIAATALVVYSPLNKFFETVPVNASVWLMALLSSLSIIVIFDIVKTILNRQHQNEA